MTTADVMDFVRAQQRPRSGPENVVQLRDSRSGLSPATVMRRPAAVSAFYGYLLTRGDTPLVPNPVPRGLPARRNRHELRGAPLVRGSGVCRGSWIGPKQLRSRTPCAPIGTGPSSRRCCSAGCGATRRSGSVSKTCALASAASLSPKARGAISVWCRCRPPSSSPRPRRGPFKTTKSLDSAYQTICEGCGFFETGPEFIPILRRQRQSATSQGDFEREHIYQELIDGLTTDKPLGANNRAGLSGRPHRDRG